jgi:2,4-dienoyl-CoA reductase-like NADH-dependent reductase (Old Yellow Enzyme family)
MRGPVPALFQPLALGGVTIPNRIVVSPMCQYSAQDGRANAWHQMHYGSLACGGAGLLVIEATAVTAQGRITPGCLGLYDDACEEALAQVVAICRAVSDVPLGLQIAHAGRKASAEVPWNGGTPLGDDPRAWPVMGPSALPFSEGWPVPRQMTLGDIAMVRRSFVAAAERALRLGFDALELHLAHGYLLHSFLSPLSNRRSDAYGGSPEGRVRLPLEIAEAVRAIWPRHRALGARLSGTDWIEGGATPDDAAALAAQLEAIGLDYLCVSSGGIGPRATIPISPGYQVPLARAIKATTRLPVRAVGLITRAHQAETILSSGDADLVAVGRGFLDDPRWGWHAADALGVDAPRPRPYARSGPKLWPGKRSDPGTPRPGSDARLSA